MFLGKGGSLRGPVEGLRGGPAKLVYIGRTDLRACQTEQKVRMPGKFEGSLYVFERLILVSQAPQGEGRPAMTQNSRVLAVGRKQTRVLLRTVEIHSVFGSFNGA